MFPSLWSLPPTQSLLYPFLLMNSRFLEHILFMCSPTHRDFGGFLFLATVNNAAINTGICVDMVLFMLDRYLHILCRYLQFSKKGMLRHKEFKIFSLGHQLLGDRVRTETQVVNQWDYQWPIPVPTPQGWRKGLNVAKLKHEGKVCVENEPASRANAWKGSLLCDWMSPISKRNTNKMN